MSNITINEALKNLFIGLGGDPSQLADNQTVSDYIADLESAIKAAATAELPTPAQTNVGKVATVIENEGAYSWGAENVPDELPTPAVGDIGKVVSVISDGESGAEYALETPASGGDVNNECVITVTKTGSQMYVTPKAGITREDILNYFSASSNDFARMNINAYIYYANSDFTVNATGMVMLNSAATGANNAKLPVFSGIITPQMDTSGSLYQAVFILGATSADDRLEIIPLTTT